ncbi:MAG: APC family permease [Gemmatimonadetes bacterium]|nr:APC family permease [Gemmatimonadota bacterium]
MTKLKRDVGTFQFFAFAFGAVVGVGWAVVLGDWLRQAGPLGAILGLTAGGFFIILIGLCYGEIAALIPGSGAEMAYAYEVIGERTGFLMGWFLAFIYVTVGGFEAISIGWILSALVPGLEGPVLYTSLGSEVRAGTLAFGVLGMGVLGWLNLRGVRSSGRAQDLLVVVLLVMAVVFLAAGLTRGDVANLQPYFVRSESGSIWPGVLALFMTASFWFGGFNVVPTMMEERDAGTSYAKVGRMIVLAILIGMVFKTGVVLSAAMTMPWQELVGANIPAATAFEKAFGSVFLAKLVLVTALLGLLSTWNAMIVCSSRILYALGRANFIMPALGRVHPVYGSPSNAILLTCIGALLVTLLGRNAILPIVNASAACLAAGYMVSCWSVIALRRSRPDAPRPFRVPGGLPTVVVALASALFSFGLALYQPWVDAKGRIPLEWVMLVAWAIIGGIAWVSAGKVRAAFDRETRRRIIVGGADV